jgi:hypothetical protein
MKRPHTASIYARKITWSLLTTTRGLSPAWVSAKVYDAAAKLLMKGTRDRYGKALLKSRSAPLRLDLTLMRPGTRKASADGDNCNYVAQPELIANVRGLAQVWVRGKVYDVLAEGVIRDIDGKNTRHLLRQRMAPLGITYKCEGTCYGGWCKEVTIQPDEFSAVYVCECSYFV